MKANLAAAALGIACAATPASADTLFAGEILFTSVSNCEFVSAGWRFRSEYLIARLGGNADLSSLSTTWNDGSIGYQLPKARFGRLYKTVKAAGWGSTVRSFDARVKVTYSKPALSAITATTPYVALKGAIQKPFDDPGTNGKTCVASFRASYLLR